jgi:hypothetical protein
MQTSFSERERRSRQNGAEPERTKWLALPCAGTPSQVKPLVDQGVFRAAVMTPLTMDTALKMLMQAMKEGSQPQGKTFVEAHSYPNLEELKKGRNGPGT